MMNINKLLQILKKQDNYDDEIKLYIFKKQTLIEMILFVYLS